MSPLFGKKASTGATVAMLDVENGSVGGALVHLSTENQPRLFAETRRELPLTASPSAAKLMRDVGHEAQEVLLHLSEVAARLRSTNTVRDVGNVGRVAVFLHAPWSVVSVSDTGKVSSVSDPEFLEEFRKISQPIFGSAPVSFHAFGGAVAPLVHTLFNAQGNSLLCAVSGEVTEILLAKETGVIGHATIPLGVNTLLRTLRTHGGFTEHEGRSALRFDHPHAREPLAAAQEHFVKDFKDVAHSLLAYAPVESVFVVAGEPVGDWFAKALAHESLGDVFTDGGSVRAVKSAHLTPHLSAHTLRPDVPLVLSALFIDARFNGI